MTAVVIVAALVLLGLGFFGGARFGASLPPAGPMTARFTRRPATMNEDRVAPGKDLTWLRTTVYLFFDRAGRLLYVGIAVDPGKRARQHAGLASAPMKPWWPEVDPARTEAWWIPNRVAACCVEWALIRYLAPPWNTAPGSSDDAYCVDQPPIEAAEFPVPSVLRARARRAIGFGGARSSW